MPKRRDWKPDDRLVLVVAAGRYGRKQARDFGLYQCQNRRSFRPARWIAFYAGGKIDTYAEVEGPPEDDVVVAARPDLRELAAAMPEPDRHVYRTVARLANVAAAGPIVNDKVDRHGNRFAWTQYQRYTTIDSLRSARRTSELKVV